MMKKAEKKEMKWSKEQEMAIDHSGHNILVSAGAGSGKTAVLTERIYSFVKKGNPITKFLVLTFTNAAAMEMKSRVRKKILEDHELAYMAPDIENAHIETFDAFCLFLVKKYANVLNISPSISVIDPTILSLQETKFIDAQFHELYLEKDSLFEEMIIKFSIKNDERLKTLVREIVKLGNLQLDKEKFYDEFDATYLKEEFIRDAIDEEFNNKINIIRNLKPLINDIEEEKAALAYDEILDYYLKATNYDELRNLIISDNKPKFGRFKANEAKDYIKSVLNNIADKDYGDSEYIISTFNSYKKYISFLVKIAKYTDEMLFDFQLEHNAFSFSEIAKMAIKLVRSEDLCEELKELFDFILVDEYQDTSNIQEEVITRISKDNLYMVGDVKQSIYRFRNANCNIFNEKFTRYKLNDGGEEIDLNKSYRSRVEIVNAINDIFGKLMTKDINIIDYENGHHFGFGFEEYSTLIQEGKNYSVDLATYTLEENETQFNREMGIVTSDIIRKINEGYKIYDKDSGFRPCTYKDFAIIIDRKSKFDEIKRYFTEKNIPITAIQDESLKNSHITYITKNLIRLLFLTKESNFEHEFKHSYCSIARSFLMNKKDSDIFREIKLNTLSELEITQKIRNVIAKYDSTSLYETLKGLYEEFDVYGKIPSIGDCSSNSHKCDTFLNYAKSMDSLGFCLKDMYNFFNEITESDNEDISFSDSSNAENAVTLINIHKSKGLEYPIVYFPFLSTKFNRNQQKSSFVADQKYGVVLPTIGRNPYDSLILHMIKENDLKEDFEEKLRLFYVALTRAREKIIMIVEDKNIKDIKYGIKKSSNFSQILCFTDYRKYLSTYEVTDEKLKEEPIKKENDEIEIKSIEVKAEEIVRKKASKEKTVEVSEELLEFGTKLHYALELLDYETKDLSYINDSRMRRYVSNVVNSYVFENIENAKILHEYRFTDEVTNVNGIIDCLIVRKNEIDIVDFKLKNISDVHYNEQLNIYADYVKKISNLPIKKYLISAITGEVREVE